MPNSPEYARWWKADSALFRKLLNTSESIALLPAQIWCMKEALWKALPQNLQNQFRTASSMTLVPDVNEPEIYRFMGFLIRLMPHESGALALAWPENMSEPQWGKKTDFPDGYQMYSFKEGRYWQNSKGDCGWLSVTHEGDSEFWAGWLLPNGISHT